MTPSNREIREALDFRDRSARRLFAAGRMQGDDSEIAVKCAWCGQFESLEDERMADRGARISDTICETCEARHFGDV